MKTKTVHLAILFAVLLMATLVMVLKPAGAVSETKTMTVPNDYQKIQEAINAAKQGDTVFVKAGIFNEDYAALNKSVSLVEDNQDNYPLMEPAEIPAFPS